MEYILRNYLDEIPEELLLIILNYLDQSRGSLSLYKSAIGLCEFLSHKNYYDKYLSLIYKGLINNFKCSKLNNYMANIKPRHKKMLKKYVIRSIDHEVNIKLEECLIYHISPEILDISKKWDYQNQDDILYIICYTNNKFYYIQSINYWRSGDSRRIIKYKEYNNWKELHSNLLKTCIVKLYQHNHIESPKDKFKSHNKNKPFNE